MKAKTRTKKLLSLLLAAIMLLGMIPATTLGVFADGPEDGNLRIEENDAAGTVYTIYGPEDWNTVAAASAAGNKFAGMKVELGASIDGSTATLTTPLLHEFAGEFDGNSDQGITISNVTFATALIAHASVSGSDTTVPVKFHDIKMTDIERPDGGVHAQVYGAAVNYVNSVKTEFTNVVFDGATLYGRDISGALFGGIWTNSIDVKIDSCKVLDTTIYATVTTNVKRHYACIGLLGGRITGGTVAITNCETQGTLICENDSNKLSGLVGGVEPDRALTLTVENTTVDAILNTVGSNVNYPVGLMFGVIHAANAGDNVVNVTVDGCTIEGEINHNGGENIGAVAGMIFFPQHDSSKLWVKNTDIDATLTMTSAGAKTMLGGAVGMITAGADKAAQGEIVFENVKVEGTLNANHGSSPAGGLIGGVCAANSDIPVQTDITISRCEIQTNLLGVLGGGDRGRGMVFGVFGLPDGNDNNTQDNLTGTYTVVDTVIGGTFRQSANRTDCGLVFGLISAKNSVIKLQNLALMTQITEDSAEGLRWGLLVGFAHGNGGNNAITAHNCVTTYDNTRPLIWDSMGTVTLHGVTPSGGSTAQYNDGSVVTMTAEQINAMIKRDTSGDILSIGGILAGGFEQHTAVYTVTPAEGAAYTAYTVRFIALSQFDDLGNAGIKVVVKDADGDVVAEFDTLACKEYDALVGYAPSGEALAPYNATDYGAEKFLAVVIQNIPTGEAYNFEVTPHYETEGALTIYGKTTVAKFDANGNLTNPMN